MKAIDSLPEIPDEGPGRYFMFGIYFVGLCSIAIIGIAMIGAVIGALVGGPDSATSEATPIDTPTATPIVTPTPEPTPESTPRPTPPATPTPSPTPEPTPTPDDRDYTESELEATFVEAMAQQDIEVTKAKHVHTWFEVDYEMTDTGLEADVMDEIARLTGSYAYIVEQGHGGEMMWAVAYNQHTGQAVGEWYVEAEWVEAWSDGELTADELMDKIEETLIVY